VTVVHPCRRNGSRDDSVEDNLAMIDKLGSPETYNH
jgi:hypothetical protein